MKKRLLALVLSLMLLGVAFGLSETHGTLYRHYASASETETVPMDRELPDVPALPQMPAVQDEIAENATANAEETHTQQEDNLEPAQHEEAVAADEAAQGEADAAGSPQEDGLEPANHITIDAQESPAADPDENEALEQESPEVEEEPETLVEEELQAPGNAAFGDFAIPSVNAGDAFTLAVPIRYEQGMQVWFSNADETGTLLPYQAGQPAQTYSQAIATVIAQAQMSLASAAEGSPFSNLPQQTTLIQQGVNAGYAVFEQLITDAGAASGDYPLLLTLTWLDMLGETHVETLSFTITVAGRSGTVTLGDHETPTAQVGGTLSLTLPIDYTLDELTLSSNTDENGRAVAAGAHTEFDQAIAQALSEVSITVSTAQPEDFPLDPAILSQSQTVLADGINAGYALFEEVPVLAESTPGIYDVNLQIEWIGANGAAQSRAVTTSIELLAGRSITHEAGIIVFTYNELKAALTGAVNGITYDTIYLGYCDSATPAEGETKNDGQIQYTATGGIAVSRNVTIIGTDPRNGQRVRLVDYTSYDISDTIRATANNLTITLQNVDVTGYNYYGILCGVGYTGVTLRFVDVTYTGRQMAYASGANSVVSITDSRVTLTVMTTGNDQEVAEAPAIHLAGNTTIVKSTASESVFWLNASPYQLTVASGAQVVAETPHYFLYTSSSSLTQANIAGSLRVQTSGSVGSMTYADQYLNTLTVEGSGALHITHNHANYASLRVNNVKVGGTLTIQRAASSYACIQMMGTQAAEFPNPVRVSLRNASGILMNGGATWTANISTQALNIWPLSGGADQYIWNNNDLAEFSVQTGSKSSVAVAQASGLQDDQGVALPPYAVVLGSGTFNLKKASRVEFGRYTLTIDPDSVYRGSASVTGTGPSGASHTVREYALDRSGGTAVLAELIQSAGAQTTGSTYQATLNTPIRSTSLSRIYTLSQLDDLHAHIYCEPSTVTQLVLVPQDIDYGTVTISGQEQLLARQSPTVLALSVLDTRDSGSWEVTVQATTPLTRVGGGDVLSDALVYRTAGQGLQSLASEVRVGGQNTTAASPVRTDLQWQADEGILLHLQPYEGMPGTSYDATLTWTLTQMP